MVRYRKLEEASKTAKASDSSEDKVAADKELSSKNVELTKKLKEVVARYRKLEATKTADAKALEAKNAEITSKLQMIVQRYKELKGKDSALREQLQQMTDKCTALGASSEKVAKECKVAKDNLAAKGELLKSLQSDLARVVDEKSRLEKQAQNVANDTSTSDAELKKEQHKCAELMAELDVLNAGKQAAEHSRNELAARVEQLSKTNEDLKIQLGSANESASSDMESIRAQISEFQSKLNAAEDEARLAKEQGSETSKRLENAQNALEEARKACSDAEAKLHESTDANAKSDEMLSNLRKEVDDAHDALKQSRTEIAELKSSYTQLKQNAANSKEEHNKAMLFLKNPLKKRN